MSCCKMKDLDGLPALQNLQEFYLPFNEVQDISVITMLSSLDVLDLERWVHKYSRYLHSTLMVSLVAVCCELGFDGALCSFYTKIHYSEVPL